MKNFDSRTYSINDFLEWSDNGQLELSPRFQRRSVWTDTARSYLMDTIIDGKPIPKVFIRQKLNPQTRKSIREVVDGQQRLRTILSFMKDGFVINKRHNKQYGGLYFSELNKVDEDIQNHLLNYEISVDLLVNMSDPDVLDVFSRLNSYSVTLNDQEKINANHFSEFKKLADTLAHKNNSFWIDNKIISEQNVLRMYEKEFDHDVDVLSERFDDIIELIKAIFGDGLSKREFRRNHVFYSLFMSLHHLQYGVANIDKPRKPIEKGELAKISQKLERIDYIFGEENKDQLEQADKQFLEDCRRATTDTPVRIRRSEFIIDVMA
jgi:hypothetical protein